DGEHSRPGDVVVVAGQGAAVGAGGGNGDEVAGGDIGAHVLVPDYDVAGFAVLAHDAHDRRFRARGSVGQGARIVSVVEGGAYIVARPAVNGDIGADSAVGAHLFDGADLVEGEHGRGDDGSAGLDRDPRDIRSQTAALLGHHRGQLRRHLGNRDRG